MLNPAEPNTVREIKITYTTDNNGQMEISIDTDGFNEDPQSVGLFLSATMAVLSESKTE
jgi:hypothetical protein